MQGERTNLNYAISSFGYDDFQSDLESGINDPDSMMQSKVSTLILMNGHDLVT